jgi:menaquinone-specific isochorismate synthase
VTTASSQHPTADRDQHDSPRLFAHTRVVESSADLLELLPRGDDALAWVQNGDGLVGWGAAARFAPSGAGRFAQAAEWWRQFAADAEVDDEVGLPGTGPVAFVSMAFADKPGHSTLVVPEIVVGRRGDVTWVTEISAGRGQRGAGTAVAMQPIRTPSTVRYAEGELSVPGYRAAVAEAVRRLRAGDLHKVVLAHDLVATTPAEEGPLDARGLLHALAGRNPNCWVFAVDGLVGATPELLLRRRGSEVTARVLAGTVWPRDGIDDDALAASLLASAKNQEEHRYAVESVADAIRPFCAALDVPGEATILRLRNVLHLATDITGTLTGDPSLLELTGATHPPAAVGGTPRAAAVALITELERMDRGRYAGPVGWIDRAGDGEFGIALRCAQVKGNTARLYAGGGIMPDSDPDSEVLEANAKMIPIRDALEQLTDPDEKPHDDFCDVTA